MKNYHGFLFLVILFLLGLNSCDNYVQFSATSPKSGTVLEAFPVDLHGVYFSESTGNSRFLICGKGFYKIELTEYSNLLEFMNESPQCVQGLADYFLPVEGRCLNIDVTGMPENAVIKLFEIDTLFGNQNDVLKQNDSRYYLNRAHNSYFSIQCLDKESKNKIRLYDLKIPDLINDHGRIVDEFTHTYSDGLHLFLIDPTDDDFFDILDHNYLQELYTLEKISPFPDPHLQ